MRSLTPGAVRDLLAAHDRRPSRALGQHFLADPNLARKIVRLADVHEGDRVLEIGPGIGSLTVALAEAGAHVVALELDRYLLPVLEDVVGDAPNVDVTQGDALDADLDALMGASEWACVSNLPYNVATPMVVRLLEEFPAMSRCLVMVQREVGERLVAGPGTKAYGAVSREGRVLRERPHRGHGRGHGVRAAAQRRRRRWCGSTVVPAPPVEVPSPDALFRLVRTGFAQRRKTLRRSLVPALGDRTEAVLAAAGIDGRTRAEALDLDDWARVCREAA